MNSKPQKPGVIIGIVLGIIGFVLLTTTCIYSSQRANRRAQNDPEIARADQRRANGGWWGKQVSQETAVERRARIVREIRESRNREGGIEREARRGRGAREGKLSPPTYQLPAPTHSSTTETRRQRSVANELLSNPPLAHLHDAPPAYDSPAVWPTRN
ncbi:hypothetical protein OPT61_g1211 [Boeremia exigua]|uniref:Uncharacterized protein n=1 Tax=Boeremia exigua TaxID=749465 RepID=A0ACC2IR96_9PLEO|nr:hypothetical protein OPT61_g1211 [Boeremia exigua]